MNTHILTNPSYQNMAVSNDGIYFISGSYLYFYDFTSNKTVFVCNKPNCKHNKEVDQFIGQECNAYLGNCSYGGYLMNDPVMYYHGYLYMKQAKLDFITAEYYGYDLLRINPDGSDRKVTAHFDGELMQLFANGKYFYYVEDWKLYRKEIENDAAPELLFPETFEQIGINNFIVNNKLYLTAGIYHDDNSKTHYGVICEIDLKDNTICLLKENIPDMYFAHIRDDYFAYNYQGSTFLYNIGTKEDTFLSNACGQVQAGDHYFYVYNGPSYLVDQENNRKVIEVYDMNFQLIDTYEFYDGIKHYTAGVIGDDLYIYYNYPEDYGKEEKIFRLSLNKKNKLEMYEFYTTYPNENKIVGYTWTPEMN